MSPNTTIRLLSLALLMIVALDIAVLTGVLVWRDHGQLGEAIVNAGIAFGGTVAFAMAVWSFFRR